MDSLTQIVLGAAVGEAVLGKKVGNKAMLYGAIAGTIPDLDTFIGNFFDTITSIEIHRGFSHSIIFAIIFAPLFGWIISKIESKSEANWKNWSWLMFWGLFTHPLLDAHTTWGTQLFWPFDLRLAYKNIFVIDPLYTLPFLIFLILPMRLKRTDPKRKKYNRLGLIISSIYLLIITIGLKIYTFQKFENALEAQNIEYHRIDTRPTPLNTILWTANIETEEAFLIGNYSVFDTQPISFYSVPKNYKLAEEIEDDPNLHRLIQISEGWYTFSKENGNLYFNDLRFGKMDIEDPAAPFIFSYKLSEENGELIATETEKELTDAKALLPRLWSRILGN
ncbi:metal-dependent hydrolase [Christiangramia forsetii]|uniref:Transmembrane metal-dependent hydrolase n=2 Tax=Christiangramia forsetii TaxID=411153 RepID=A0LXF8_CHRFK|nr:metal-dependent hydrolase [Christiangramia forsetii]GGG36941.1 membrane protein [Christiangramia forsetii]CAL65053.1 transmembrane metal-dependent hydrolase [Christiangramia forsetii KT0803]